MPATLGPENTYPHWVTTDGNLWVNEFAVEWLYLDLRQT